MAVKMERVCTRKIEWYRHHILYSLYLQRFDTAGWVTERASGLQNTLLQHFAKVLFWSPLRGVPAQPGKTSAS